VPDFWVLAIMSLLPATACCLATERFGHLDVLAASIVRRRLPTFGKRTPASGAVRGKTALIDGGLTPQFPD
jgi:hypothetical protein